MGNLIGWYDTTEFSENENSDCSVSEYDDGIVKDANMTRGNTRQNYKHFEQIIEQNINVTTVTNLEKNLDTYEKVSLVFLLYDSPHDALEVMKAIITGDNKSKNLTPISNWAKTCVCEWKGKLVEALGIIQNYEELASLGFNKADVDSNFQPYLKETHVHINKFHKLLFKFCESFTREDCKKLIDSIKIDGVELPWCSDDVYLEVHFLSWINDGYISRDDSTRNLRFLSKLEDLHFSDKASEVEKIIKIEGYENRYKILDHRNVGICLIINQRDFDPDKRWQFADIVNTELEKREGTDIDCKRLRETFENLNISVHVRENLVHDKMIPEITSTIEDYLIEDRHSVFFLCILSHGAKGAVYGSNGISVKIDSIVNCLTSGRLLAKLRSKPKVIIVQACQGKSVQKIDDDDDVDTDSPRPKHQNNIPSSRLHYSDEFVPRLSDVLKCQAVVNGYVALRDKNKGSIYIQNLCKQLNKSGKTKDVESIVTDVHYEVGQIHHPILGVMTPELHSRLRKKLYLVPKSER